MGESNTPKIPEGMKRLVGRKLERIEMTPLGLRFHFSGGLVYQYLPRADGTVQR